MLKSQAELQSAVDVILDRCAARPNLRAKALSEKLVKIDFANPPLDVFQDRALKCVMTEGKVLTGATFAVIGSEQYIDDEASRQ